MNYKSALLKQNKKIFKTDDLALLWGITNRNTLRTTIKRYLKDKTFYSIRRGVYSVVPLKNLDPYVLGVSYVKGFSYISLHSILEKNGLINQSLAAITIVAGRSCKFFLSGNNYIAKKMVPKYLYNLEGINLQGDYPIARVERAIADTLYYNANFHFDADISKYKEKIKLIQRKVFYESSKKS